MTIKLDNFDMQSMSHSIVAQLQTCYKVSHSS